MNIINQIILLKRIFIQKLIIAKVIKLNYNRTTQSIYAQNKFFMVKL
jgi:hypothetical protein